jgi:SAM-dependent MidA family methyltransferase
MSHAPADSGVLLDSLRQRIARHGPMRVDEYMRACLEDPRHGYWQRTATIGAGGDFITAPEISQIFGELIGLWCMMIWESMGRPSLLHLVELGPGRGTLMQDALRVTQKRPEFADAVSVHLIEASVPLRGIQRRVLAGWSGRVSWHDGLAEVPPGAAVVIANEFLDALPVRQLVYGPDAWHERVVDASPDGGLRFAVGPRAEFSSVRQPEPGAIVELRAGEDDLLRTLSARAESLAALFMDYGPAEAVFGDTLQAVRRHAYADPLADPGIADLTAHVHFASMAQKIRAAELAAYGPVTQLEFLGRLGILERAQRLMAANPTRAPEIETAVLRLISPTGMGGLFKAMAAASRDLPPPPPFG